MWVMGTEPGFSARAVSVLHYWAISLALNLENFNIASEKKINLGSELTF